MAYCIACEIDQPVDNKLDDWAYGWYFGNTFFSALLGLRRALLVPIFSVLCLLAAQPLGGLPLESFFDNEWPFIVGVGTPLFGAVFLSGVLLRSGFQWYSRRA